MTPDDPITLAAACEIVFGGAITPSSLRAAHSRGELVIFRVGRCDFTTLAHVREFIEFKCHAAQKAQGFTVTRRVDSMSSETVAASLDAAQRALSKLRNGWPDISPQNIGRSKARAR